MGQAFGVVGLEVMGRNVAQNIERNGFPVAVYNRTYAKTEEFMAGPAAGKNFKAARRPSLRSSALYTIPIPPPPSTSSTR